MAEIVTEPGDGDALHVALGDVERGLGFSEMHGQGLREVRDACACQCMRLCICGGQRERVASYINHYNSCTYDRA